MHMPLNLIRLSKFMSLVLRHRAQAFGLTPDAEGFVPLERLVAIVEKNSHRRAGRAEIVAVVEHGQPQRFELRGDLIRATYGHSLKSEALIRYPTVVPLPTLFHGTHPQAVPHICTNGLRAMQRQYVHLSTTLERAREVARRHTKTPVILIIRAQAARAAGIVFHSPEPKHFLVRAIPPEFILFPETSYDDPA